MIDNLPFDKYELEPSPLTQYILSRKQPTVCWQVGGCNYGGKCSFGFVSRDYFFLCHFSNSFLFNTVFCCLPPSVGDGDGSISLSLTLG